MHYLDTSLLVACLTPEPRTHEMQDWLAGQPPAELAISDWVITEFSGALSLKLRSGQVDGTGRADALSMFNALVDESLTVFPITSLDFRTAARHADRHETGLRSGDALHLAVAGNHGARLQTLDKGLAGAAQALGVSATLM